MSHVRTNACFLTLVVLLATGSLLAQEPAPIKYLVSITSELDFETVSTPSARAGDVERTTKFLLPVRSDPGLVPLLFQNTNLYAYHREFLIDVFPAKFPALSVSEYLALVEQRATRQYYAGTISRYRTQQGVFYGFGVFTDQIDPAELLTADETRAIHASLVKAFPLTPFVYAPESQQARLAARDWVNPGFPVYLGSATEAKYQSYTLSTGYGRVRLMTLVEFNEANLSGRINWQDILILERAPSDIEGVVAGIITAEPQGELSHVAIRTARRNTPNAYLRDALEVFKPLAGKLIRLHVGRTEYSAQEAQLEDAEKWWRDHRPKLAQIPLVDPDYGELDRVEEIDLSNPAAPAESRFGGKATNFARLQRILTGELERYRETGFAIPMRYYLEFLRSNFTRSLVNPNRLVTYEEYLQELFVDANFLSDPTVRFEALKQLRETMEDDGKVAAELVAAVRGRIEQVFGLNAAPVRFRSSSNVEDALEFNGAGLYDSTTACAADHRDADDDGPSRCDPTQPRERRIERALKRVWASLWTFRAHEERAYYQIPQELAAMAVFVSSAYLDEQANGVAFTGNPTNRRDGRLVVTAQKGEESVVSPDPGKLPEKNLLEVQNGIVVRIERVQGSTLVPPGELVISDASLKELGAVLAHVHKELPVDLGGHQRSEVLFDVEFKIEAAGSLAIKQVRPFLARDTLPLGPTFELVVPPDTRVCGAFMDARTPGAEYAVKSQIRLVEGKLELGTAVPTFQSRLIEEVLFGPDQVAAISVVPGRFRLKVTAEGNGNATYQFSHEETFALNDGQTFVVRLEFLDFNVQAGVLPALSRTVNEEFILDQMVLFGVPGGDSSRLVRYSSCSYETIPLWHGRVELEAGDRVLFEERYFEEPAGSGPANLVFAQVQIAGVQQSVADYWRLVYAAEHHNVHVRYWIVLDPPLALPSGDAVRVVEINTPQIETRTVAQAAYLDSTFKVIARPKVTCFRRALAGEALSACSFRRGDIDGSGSVSLTDAIALLVHLFQGGRAPVCADAADFEDDGAIELTDAVLILSFLFRGVNLSAPPGPYECGPDPSVDSLGEDCADESCR